MPLVKGDGSGVLFQCPEESGPHFGYSVFQQFSTDPTSLQDRLDEELLDLALRGQYEAFYDTIVVDPDVVEEICVPPCDGRDLQHAEIEFIVAEDGVELESVIKNLNLSDPSCFRLSYRKRGGK